MRKLINFNDFAQFLTGVNDREEQLKIFAYSPLIDVNNCEEISECELMQLFDKKCEISQTFEPFHEFYEIIINGKWTCDIVEKFI